MRFWASSCGAASGEGTSIETTQTDAWLEQIAILKTALASFSDAGSLYFEYSIPRLGKRIDVLALIGPVIFVLEFKVGEDEFTSSALDQVCDYALDLKNFHETSHAAPIAPIVIPTRAENTVTPVAYCAQATTSCFRCVRRQHRCTNSFRVCCISPGVVSIETATWETGRYHPTPTIIEAAMALYGGHKVEEISKKDAGAANLARHVAHRRRGHQGRKSQLMESDLFRHRRARRGENARRSRHRDEAL